MTLHLTGPPSRVPTRLAVCAAADGAANFAADDALMALARATGGSAWRVYSWSGPTVSFGRNERVLGRFDAERFAQAGIDVVRRVTGGRALLHASELTFAAAGPVGTGDTLSATYRQVTDVVASALRRLGVAATIAARRAPSPTPAATGTTAPAVVPCFAQPSAGEIVVGESKLVASAQFRDGGAFLQHGSILVDDDQSLLVSGLAPGAQMPSLPRPATLRALLGRAVTTDEFAEALAAELRAVTGDAPLRFDANTMLDATVVRDRIAHYRDAAWTWRH